jgi:hypothetical protein
MHPVIDPLIGIVIVLLTIVILVYEQRQINKSK